MHADKSGRAGDKDIHRSLPIREVSIAVAVTATLVEGEGRYHRGKTDEPEVSPPPGCGVSGGCIEQKEEAFVAMKVRLDQSMRSGVFR